MTKTNRNNPCRCGSGKKYKKCCLLADEAVNLRYRRWERVESDLIPKLIDFTFEDLGSEFFADAWKDFFGEDDLADEFDPEDPMTMVFLPWLFFSRRLDFKPKGSADFFVTTIAELFLHQKRPALTPEEETLVLNFRHCAYSLCEVVEANPGVGMTQFDLLRRVKYDVTEVDASRRVKPGEIIFCAPTELDGLKLNIGMGPYALPPNAKQEILELRKWIVDLLEREDLTADDLQEFAEDVRGLYLDLLSEMVEAMWDASAPHLPSPGSVLKAKAANTSQDGGSF